MRLTSRTAQRTLAYVNRLRKEYRRRPPLKRLPRGQRNDKRHCPIALAIGGEVFPEEIRINGDILTPPRYVAEFIEAFDDGRIPELSKK